MQLILGILNARLACGKVLCVGAFGGSPGLRRHSPIWRYDALVLMGMPYCVVIRSFQGMTAADLMAIPL